MTHVQDLRRDGVLLVTQQLGSVRSGVGTYARTIVGGLLARGVPLTVATWDKECDAARFEGVEFWRLGEPGRMDPTPGGWHTLGRRAAGRLRECGRRFGVVHFLDAREGHATLRRNDVRRLSARFVGTVHDDYAVRAPRWPTGLRGKAADPIRRWAYYAWLRRLERRTLPKFDVLATNSAATTESIVGEYSCDPGRCHVAPLTIEPLPAVFPAQLVGSPRLLFVGGNFFRKGLDAVIDALPALCRRHPGVTLHIAGRDPAERLLQRRAHELGVADAIAWHGRIDPTVCASMFAASDVLVVPSRTEALGLVYLEAFAAGVPVVAGLEGGVAEIVVHGESGMQARTDGTDIAQLVDAVLSDADLRRRIVAGGRRVLAERTVDRLVDATIATYLDTPAEIRGTPHGSPHGGTSVSETAAASCP